MDPRDLRISDFSYHLPDDRIAQRPLAERDATKLLVHRDGTITDRTFRDLPQELAPGTLLVLNDTRVVQARLTFRRATGAVVECMVLTPAEGRPIEQALLDRGRSRWWCLVGNAKRWKGEALATERDGRVLRMERTDLHEGEHLIAFSWEGDGTFLEQLGHFGAVPLPPYMRRASDAADEARYNTVFSTHPGSVAAPTASLHFTAGLLGALSAQGVRQARVTLHVGAGTFLPVKSGTMAGHGMHAEQLRIPRTTVETLRAHVGQGLIVPVGTTALRTLESLYWHGAALAKGKGSTELRVEQWQPYAGDDEVSVPEALDAVLARMRADGTDAVTGDTRLLIAPGYCFRLADGLITNFHQPHSTLLLLVAALVGPDWKRIYAHALEHGYRFLSYGDGSLLWRDQRASAGGA